MAVGFYNPGKTNQTLIEQDSGSGWKIVSSPNAPGGSESVLNAVACVSVSHCWAVGHIQSNATGSACDQTLIEEYTGSAWSIVPSPNTNCPGDTLSGVSCDGAGNCWAVGAQVDGSNAPQTLIEQWNGSVWAIVPTPNSSTSQYNNLTAVVCSGLATDCWAVGIYYNGTGTSGSSQTLAEHDTGSGWGIVSSPNTSTSQPNQLQAVTCYDSTHCLATGTYSPSNSTEQTLVEAWNGASWSLTPSPNVTGAQYDDLFGVSCQSAASCYAVGGAYTNPWQTLIEQWDGSTWTIVASPNTSPSDYNILSAVSCATSGFCAAAGAYGNTNQTLIEEASQPESVVPEAHWPALLIPIGGVAAIGMRRQFRRGVPAL